MGNCHRLGGRRNEIYFRFHFSESLACNIFYFVLGVSG